MKKRKKKAGDQDGMPSSEHSIEKERELKEPFPKFHFEKPNKPSLKPKQYQSHDRDHVPER